jgi:hypothetical protein
MNDARFDLSPLDPARDAERWERRIAEVVACTLQARRWTVSGQLSRWARPALGLAAAAALFSWLGLALRLPLDGAAERDGRSETDPSSLLSSWAANDARPSTGTLLSVLGEK